MLSLQAGPLIFDVMPMCELQEFPPDLLWRVSFGCSHCKSATLRSRIIDSFCHELQCECALFFLDGLGFQLVVVFRMDRGSS